ncbi:MAG TPA: hypothetical protein PKK48_04260, partial [Phycisphaerae bacterium]|nr:hypothetical protein [Phycisphaerae bacterium]
MKDFLTRISSRKFLTAFAVEIAAVAALFSPERASEFNDAAIRIAAIVTMALTALGYGCIEASLDNSSSGSSTDET